MKKFTYPELLVHIPMCTHKLPKAVLVVSDDDSMIQEELARYSDVSATTISVANALESIRNMEDNSFDIVLFEGALDEVTLAHVNRITKEDALIVSKNPTLDDAVEENKAILTAHAKYFKVIMPYRVFGDETLLLSSKEYHPTADVILQRSDLLDGQSYYNCDIHTAVFVMPNYIRKEYLGFIKN